MGQIWQKAPQFPENINNTPVCLYNLHRLVIHIIPWKTYIPIAAEQALTHTYTRKHSSLSSVHSSFSALALLPVILTPGENWLDLPSEKVFLINWVSGLCRHYEWCSHAGPKNDEVEEIRGRWCQKENPCEVSHPQLQRWYVFCLFWTFENWWYLMSVSIFPPWSELNMGS